MANEETENATVGDNEVVNSVHTNGTDIDSIEEPSGWLLKRSKISHKWKKQWFQLQSTELLYGDEEGVSYNLQNIIQIFLY